FVQSDRLVRLGVEARRHVEAGLRRELVEDPLGELAVLGTVEHHAVRVARATSANQAREHGKAGGAQGKNKPTHALAPFIPLSLPCRAPVRGGKYFTSRTSLPFSLYCRSSTRPRDIRMPKPPSRMPSVSRTIMCPTGSSGWAACGRFFGSKPGPLSRI